MARGPVVFLVDVNCLNACAFARERKDEVKACSPVWSLLPSEHWVGSWQA